MKMQVGKLAILCIFSTLSFLWVHRVNWARYTLVVNTLHQLGQSQVYCRKGFLASYRILLEAELSCEEELVVFILCKPEDRALRKAVRETWGRELEKSGNASIVFVLGAPSSYQQEIELAIESDANRDMLQVYVCELYELLSLKVHAFLEWRKCSHKSPYVLKLDMDTFILVGSFWGFLDLIKRAPVPSIWCLVSPRTETPKTVPKNIYDHDHLPPYCSGHAYLLGRGLARKLADGAMQHYFLGVEDILFTGLIPTRLGIDRKHSNLFLGELPTRLNCKSANYVTIHRVRTPEKIRQIWKEMSGLKPCFTKEMQ